MIKIEEVLKNDYQKWKNNDYIFEKENGVYKSITFGKFIEKSVYLAEYLLSKNLKGKRIMIFSENSINWMITDIAVMSYVGESVTISKEWKYDDVDYAINLLNIDCIIYSTSKKEIVNQIKNKYKDILYICIEEEYNEILKIGKELNNKKSEMFDFESKSNDECVKIIFTSGTSSMPKAVKLSLKNIFSGAKPLSLRTKLSESDICYLFLPLTHTYGNIYNFVYSLLFGFKIYLASSTQEIPKELLEVNPTIFCSVPLIYINMYNMAKDNLTKVFGNKIRYLFCGGANWDKNIRKFYKDSGLNLLEAYALSETASSFSIEYPNRDDFESVGTIFEDIDVKIIDKDKNGHGEIVVKGDNVFLGYANNEEETKKAFTDDGYFKTGDIGFIDDKNRLYIVGRKKKVLLGNNGENISINRISDKIKETNDNISSVKLFIKNGKLNCSIYLKKEDSTNWEKIISDYNKNCPKYERIQEYQIIIDSVYTRLKQ